MRRCDGIGRRARLKISWWQHRAGSTPATGTSTVPVRPTTLTLAGSLTIIRKDSCTSLTAQLVCGNDNRKNSACAPDHVDARRLTHYYQKR